jgi:hypothetical protein
MTSKPFNKFRLMKNLIAVAMLFMTLTANAQSWHFGPKLDANYSSISGNGMKSSFAPGWQIGAFVEKKLNNKWSIQPELLYSWNRYKKSNDFMTYYVNSGRASAGTNINLATISVPVLVRYNLNKTFSLLAGPQYSYIIYDDENLLRTNYDAFKNYEISANAGIQVNIDNVGFYARFNKGLSNINNIDERYKWYSQHVQVGIAVQIK